MSGHSKWSNIKTKKEKIDNERAKFFTKLSKCISAAVKSSGADLNSNSRLRDLIAKAKANNVPSDNIERLIKKASGEVDKNFYEEVCYEGYGPCGVAILVEALTDNRNRTAANLRHYFDKFGGKLAVTGCVSYLFSQKGVICAEKPNLTEEEVLEFCVNFEISDFELEEEILKIKFEPSRLYEMVDVLKGLGFEILFAEVNKVANNFVSLTDEDGAKNFDGLVKVLDEDDDVQQFWTNIKEQC